MTTRHPIRSDAVWTAADVVDPGNWTYTFTEVERDGLVDAVRRATAMGKTTANIEVGDIDLRDVISHVGRWVEAIDRGHGFVLLRRFPVDRLSKEEAELGYLASIIRPTPR